MKTHKSLMASCLSVLSITLFIQHAQAAAAFDPNSPWMLGDWNGQRTALQAQGYDFFFWIYRRICRYFRFKKIRLRMVVLIRGNLH